MKTKIYYTEKFEISKSFEKQLAVFLESECVKYNDYIEYIMVSTMTCSNVMVAQSDKQITMRIEEIGLSFNYNSTNTRITLYWKHQSGMKAVYPHDIVEDGAITFWMEGLDEFADRIRNRFTIKPAPNLIAGYSFRVEMWKWDGVDAILEITTSAEHLPAIEAQIHSAVEYWNDLFEKGKKTRPIHYVGEFTTAEEGFFEIHVDTGYCGLPALKHIFKYIDKAKIPIVKIEF